MTDQGINKKLAKAVGFRPTRIIATHWHNWLYPDGTEHSTLPDFLNDMNACLKWIVPEIKLPDLVITFHLCDMGTRCWINGWLGQLPKQKDYARALSLAALKYFEEMGK